MDNLKLKRYIKPFDGEKYNVWKFRIRALLCELDALQVIDNEVPETITDEWMKAEKIAKSIIIEYLSDSFLGFAKSDSTAAQILKSLDDIFERNSFVTKLSLCKRLLELKLQGDTPLTKHFTIFDELIFDLLAAGTKLEETDKIVYLLLTLPTTYNDLMTNSYIKIQLF